LFDALLRDWDHEAVNVPTHEFLLRKTDWLVSPNFTIELASPKIVFELYLIPLGTAPTVRQSVASQWNRNHVLLPAPWQGLWVLVLAAVLLTEILLTLADFVVEIRVRKPLGDVYGGERVTHAVMGIIYGAMVANFIPVLWSWWPLPTAIAPDVAGPELLGWVLAAMATGVFLSGVRDLYASLGLPHGGWPWVELPSSGDRS
jgi:hypothetical protein